MRCNPSSTALVAFAAVFSLYSGFTWASSDSERIRALEMLVEQQQKMLESMNIELQRLKAGQLRGLVANDHLEYRAGVYQGERGETSENGFRYVGRVVFYPFEADKGFYYAGTTLGKKRILALGAGIDHQESYDAYALDLFYDQPVGNGNGLTLQLGGIRYDGGEIFPQLSLRETLQVEAGFYWDRFKIQPFVTYYALDRDEEDLDDQSRLGVGLGYYMKGFNRNLKFSYTDIRTDNLPSRSQWLLQLQIFMF